MTRAVVVTNGDGGGAVSGGRTVVVGVKLDAHSRELLTWALVKVAQPGDRVTALHVLNNNDIVDRDGKSSLLSLVKAFDSVLAVYEGFCNLRQVDLKLKICRGSSIRKILVREAKSYFATELILGTARNHHTIKSSVSVAKYCAKKLKKDCSTLAVNNGKIIFQKEALSSPRFSAKDVENDRRINLLTAIQRSLSKNTAVVTNSSAVKSDKCSDGISDLVSENCCPMSPDSTLSKHCAICSRDAILPYDSSLKALEESSGEDNEVNSMAIVPVPSIETASSSISLLVRELPEIRPGWPLLRQTIISNRRVSRSSSVRQISVVQWALRLPSRHFHSIENSDEKARCDLDENQPAELNEETGAIVPVGDDARSAPCSRETTSKTLPKELAGLHEKYSATCRLFEYEELCTATSKFIPDNKIGKGGSSEVYRGYLRDGKELAVKILKPSEDALKEFVMEIEIITALNHKNIISLFGFCYDDNHLLLVYDFLPRGSLEENLHGTKKDAVGFGWSERYKVAVAVAEALEYLHTRDTHPVIHRDVKSSNILLSDDFEPQLSDFGLAKWASTTSSHITCADVAGTFGYLAPEYFMYGKVNDKIDVYAFGVVLLELLSGRKPISNENPKGQESLVMWAKPILNCGKFTELLDSSLGSNYNYEQVERVVLAAALCIRRAPRARPQISLIVKLLRGDAETIKWARLQVNASEGSDTAMIQVNNTIEGGDALDEVSFSKSNLQSHLNLALLGVEDSLSVSSIEQTISLEDYLRGRWSRSSSFD